VPVNLESIRRRALELPHRIVLVDGEDERVMEASIHLLENGRIEPVLVGDRAVIQARLRGLGAGVEVEVADPEESSMIGGFAKLYQEKMLDRKGKSVSRSVALERVKTPSYFAAMLLETGEVDGLVGGSSLSTAHILRAALDVVGLTEDAGIVSGAFAMFLPTALPSGQNVLMFADCAVVPSPDAKQLAAIAANTVRVTKKVLGMEPIVAFTSFSTKGSADHFMVDKVVRAVELSKEKMPDVLIDGELQVDTALIPEVAQRKAPGSEVRGRANILIFPDLNSGNMAYKLAERLARAEALGVILEGFNKPVNDLSRGCSVQSVIDMICVTALQVRFDPSMEDVTEPESSVRG
jgi:phosphate acetyltransferase